MIYSDKKHVGHCDRGTMLAYCKGNQNRINFAPHFGKNPFVTRTKRESYRNMVYPSQEKRNRRNG